MHQIEEILKQLNEKSAVIQPGTVELLSTIQERLMRRSGQQLPAQTDETGLESKSKIPTLQEDSALEETPAEIGLSQQSEFSPLLRSIMDSNRRLRGDQQQSVAQPRFLAQKSVAVSSKAAIDSISEQESKFEQYSLDRSVDFGFELNEFASDSVVATQMETTETTETAGNTEVGAHTVSVRFPGFVDTAGLNTATPATTKPTAPPVPHFERAEKLERGESVRQNTNSIVDPDRKLPIFDSAWFRRSAPTKAVAKIVDSILLKVPPVAPATLQFTQSLESKAEGAQIATQVAWELSRRVQDNVLLIDADFQLREISRQLENVYLPGLGESLNRDEPTAAMIRKTGVDRLYWLPSGQSDISFRKTTAERWSQISAELKAQFQYVCIYSGGAEEKVATTWSRFCDFTFLIASMTDDLGPATEELIGHLRKHDSRVAGLITVD